MSQNVIQPIVRTIVQEKLTKIMAPVIIVVKIAITESNSTIAPAPMAEKITPKTKMKNQNFINSVVPRQKSLLLRSMLYYTSPSILGQ